MAIFTTSKYITKDFLNGRSLPLTVAREPERENVGKDEKPDIKYVVRFVEVEEGLPLNKTRGGALVTAHGADMANWVGKKVEVYVDPAVMFGGKKVGGLAIKAL